MYEIIHQVLRNLALLKNLHENSSETSLQNSHQKSSDHLSSKTLTKNPSPMLFDFLYCPTNFSHSNPLSRSILQSCAAFSFHYLIWEVTRLSAWNLLEFLRHFTPMILTYYYFPFPQIPLLRPPNFAVSWFFFPLLENFY